MKKTPKYAQIEAELIAQIESGQLAPGAELPSESDLIECYGVSRVTVRRAIDELYHQGYKGKFTAKVCLHLASACLLDKYFILCVRFHLYCDLCIFRSFYMEVHLRFTLCKVKHCCSRN